MCVDREFGRLLQTTNPSTTERKDIMSKLLTTLLAATFAAATLTPIAFAAKHEMSKEDAAALAKACKDKKPGEEVTVDGKKVKCPAPKKEAKKEMKKDEMKK